MRETRLGLLLMLALGACRTVPAAPESASPVISFTLIVGDSIHRGSVSHAARADSTVPGQLLGIDSTDVDLLVIAPDGSMHPLRPLARDGDYEVRLHVVAGATYRLSGRVAGRTVNATTTAPVSFTISQPTADTITAADGFVTVADFLLRVPYRFESTGVLGYEVRILSGGQGGALQQFHQRDVGELVFLPDPAVRRVAFLGYNPDAAEWLIGSTPRSNVDGAFGGFGAAIVQRKWVFLP